MFSLAFKRVSMQQCCIMNSQLLKNDVAENQKLKTY